ncbi:MAG: glycosyltransferase family 4 protein [Anaerolineales bacterium]
MRILVLIHEYPPIGGGGGRVAQDVARGLAARGHAVCVLAPHMRGLSFDSLDDGVRVMRVPSLRRQAFVGDILAMSGYLVAGFFAALHLVRQFRPDVIHVHFAVPAGVLAWVLSRLTGIPYVLTTHLGDVPGGVPEKTDRWFRWIYPFTPRIWQDAADVIAISDFTQHLAQVHYPVPMRVIPNGVQSSVQPADIHVQTPPHIIFAGRFVPQKDPLLIPDILYSLRDLLWHCTLIGDGPLCDSVMQKTRRLGLQDRVTFTGWGSQNAVMEHLLAGDILLLPSRAEGIPMVGLQALAAGLAIVASPVGGVPELVQVGRNGFLHPPGDPEPFAHSLRTLISDAESLRRARLASLEISQRFDLTCVVTAYENALHEAAHR